MINYLANYFYEGTIRDPRVAVKTQYRKANLDFDSDEKDIDDITKSKTVKCKEYGFELNDFIFRFLDTPGFNDTKGFHDDSKNVQEIFKYIQTQESLAAFILVVNGARPRQTINITNVLETIRNSIPDEVYSNMIVVLTNCHEYSCNFTLSSWQLPDSCSVFHMQNSAFSQDHHTWRQDRMIDLENDFKKSIKTINKIITMILRMKPISTRSFKLMDDERNAIKLAFHDAKMMIFDLQQTEDEIYLLEQAVGNCRRNELLWQEKMQKKNLYTERIPTSYHSTLCKKCTVVCHEECRLQETSVSGSRAFQGCQVMHQGYCTKCPQRCSFEDHYHDHSILRTVSLSIPDVMGRLNIEKNIIKQFREKATSLNSTKNAFEQKLRTEYQKVKDTVMKLKQQCSNVNVATELFHFVEDLKTQMTTLKSRNVIEKANQFILDIEQLCDPLENAQQGNPKRSTTQSSNSNVGDKSSNAHQRSQKPSTFNNQKEITEPVTISESKRIKETQSQIHNARETNETSESSEDHINSEKPRCNNIADCKNGSDTSKKSNYIMNDKSDEENCPQIEDLSARTTKELLLLGKNKSVKKELHRRCTGQSLGFLTMSTQYILCNEFAKHYNETSGNRYKRASELSDIVYDLIDGDPYNITKVEPRILLELAALHLLIKSQET